MNIVLAGLLLGSLAAADVEPLFAPDGPGVVRWNEAALREAVSDGEPVTLKAFPLPGGRLVDLEVERFSVTGPGTRFVVGRRHGEDVALDFDPGRVTLLRGRVSGSPGSHVFVALAGESTTGFVDLGNGAAPFRLSSRDAHGRSLETGATSVFRTSRSAGLPPEVPMCGTEHLEAGASAPASPTAGVTLVPGRKHLELAVETDYELFELFGDLDATASYLTALYGEISAIYLRDLEVHIELVFARLWDDPDDLFNVVEPTPLPDFRTHWNGLVGVPRDVAQLLSGRRDYPFGGQAYISAICGDSAYSVVGYTTGFFPDPSMPSPYSYDILVAAHEIGHNAGASHTHDAGLDQCNNPFTSAQRGSIMSYCGQTWTGGNANHDMYFHEGIQNNMNSFLSMAACVVADCNLNGVFDGQDLVDGSADVNGNSVPDECEDCNGNGVLDDEDIAAATSADVDADGIPDECEIDCDGNGVPDALQIAQGSVDAYGNGIPDECEADCDDDGVSDYTEIQLDMTLDVNRNAVLDACEDCDDDGTLDLDALAGAHDVWVASDVAADPLRRFHATAGVEVGISSGLGGSTIQRGQDVLVTPDGRVLVTSGADHRVMEFAVDGTYVGDLVPPLSGGLSFPTGMALKSDGTLLVASRDGNAVLAFDGASGAFLGDFVAAGTGGIGAPYGLALGPDGHLFVAGGNGRLVEYDVEGALVRVLAGGLAGPRGVAVTPTGLLLVTLYDADEVRAFELATGEALGKWARVGTATVLTQDNPWGIRVGPNGNVFVVRSTSGAEEEDGHDHDKDHGHDDTHDVTSELHLSNTLIYEYDIRNGGFVRSYVMGNDHGLRFPSGFDFLPGWEVDCNFNLRPDVCDIADGVSLDDDGGGVPDECEVDCNGNGVLDRLDVVPYGTDADCNANLEPDGCELASGRAEDCDGNGVPDGCDPDCNANGIVDACEIAAGSVSDCNSNGVPDPCDATFDFETEQGWVAGWPGDVAFDGTWVRDNPLGTSAQPEFDRTGDEGRACWFTGQGVPGAGDDSADVDGGWTSLVSPVLDLSGDPDPEISYWRWLSNDTGVNPGEDPMLVEVSNDGGAGWTTVETVGPGGAEATGGWLYHRFRVSDFVAPTSDVRVRFFAQDIAGDSIVEAAVDDVLVVGQCCTTSAACDDALSCTVETCNAAAGQCLNELVPGSCLIEGGCFADGELNPADDCERCDAASPEAWADARPQDVRGLAAEYDGTSTRLTWVDEEDGSQWDVVSGTVSILRIDGDVSSATCLADAIGSSVFDDSRPGPFPGDAFYYLVRSEKSCGAGTYGTDSAGVVRVTTGCP